MFLTARTCNAMGTAWIYTCPECGYQSDLVSSGYDVGMASHVVGISCANCKELYSASLPGKPWDADWDAMRQKVESGELPAGARCPKSAKHHVKVWSHPGPCPRCGTTLSQGEGPLCWD
jgi:Zn finger protein HypA/HybF involved in hydrogenase expression